MAATTNVFPMIAAMLMMRNMNDSTQTNESERSVMAVLADARILQNMI